MARNEVDGVTMHANWNGPWLPSVNVKMGLWRSRHSFPDAEDVAARLGICQTCAQGCVEKAFDVQQDYFWRCMPILAEQIFGPNADAVPAGRSSGWVSVTGIGEGGEIASWDKKMRVKWGYFEEEVHRLIDLLCGLDDVVAEIQAHGWAQSCSYIKGQCMTGNGGEL